MERGDHKIFNRDKKKLAELIHLRKAGWSIRSLAFRYNTNGATREENVDTKAVRYRLKQLGIAKPKQVIGIQGLIRRNLRHFLPKLDPNGFRKKPRSYAEYVQDSKKRN